jgi:hypothetical protein
MARFHWSERFDSCGASPQPAAVEFPRPGRVPDINPRGSDLADSGIRPSQMRLYPVSPTGFEPVLPP